VEAKPKRKVNWRNVLLLCCLASPLLYVGDYYLPHMGPAVTSPEGRAIWREFVVHYFPDIVINRGVRK